MAQSCEFLFGYTNMVVNGVIILIIILNFVVHKFRQLQEEEELTEQKNRLLSLSTQTGEMCYRFSLDQMRRATSNFHDDLVIGKGGFGKVYKGTFEVGPTVVAIKRLDSMSNQGSLEFRTEIKMLSKLRHSHLVSLIGYCDDGREMILVYEFMPGGTLADHLYIKVRQGDTSSTPLSWIQRLKICIGAARGLDYLHTGTGTQNRIIHRDVKTTNILLDENFAAKISDFGLSKIGPANQADTFVSTQVKGSFGYFDPYYFQTNRLTRKSDVYAFGVVLFEVLCGRPAVDTSLKQEQWGLAGWAQHCYREGLLGHIIDPKIKEEVFPDCLVAFVNVAIQCLHSEPKQRPNMAEVVVALESALVLQEKSSDETITSDDNEEDINEIITSDDNEEEDIDSSQLEVENAGSEKGMVVVSEDSHQQNRSSTKMKFGERLRVFLARTARALSANRAKKPEILELLDLANSEIINNPALKVYKYNDLKVSTRNFHPDSLLGRGQYCNVYKGWVDEKTFDAAKWGTGLPTAIMQFNDEDSQEKKVAWVVKEIVIHANFCHPNIVKLIGCCLETEIPLLVYEFVCQGSLRTHLFRSDGGTEFQPLSWKLRISIALGAAKGLAYLHSGEINVIHRDIKTSHILIDSDYNAKLSGLIGWTRRGRSHESAMTTLDCGMLGYLDPDYFYTGHLTMKTDVYSFGVVLLEILTGRHAIDMKSPTEERNIVTWAMSRFNEYHGILDIIDANIQGQYSVRASLKATSLALKCVSLDPEPRPDAIDMKSPTEERNIVTWAMSRFNEDHGILDIMDANIQGQYSVRAALKATSLALKCVSLDPEPRPDAKQVVEELEQLLDLVNSENINNPTENDLSKGTPSPSTDEK